MSRDVPHMLAEIKNPKNKNKSPTVFSFLSTNEVQGVPSSRPRTERQRRNSILESRYGAVEKSLSGSNDRENRTLSFIPK